MSDKYIGSISSVNADPGLSSPEIPAKPLDQPDSPKVRSGSAVDGGKSFFTQGKTDSALPDKVQAAFRDKNAEAVHTALSEAVSGQDYAGVCALVNQLHHLPPTAKERQVLDAALKLPDASGNTVLDAANLKADHSGPGMPTDDKVTAIRIRNLLKCQVANPGTLSSSATKNQEPAWASTRPAASGSTTESRSKLSDPASKAEKKVSNRSASVNQIRLFLAIESGDAKRLNEFLYDSAIDLNTFHPKAHPNAELPLLFAVRKGNIAVIRLLIKHGANINMQDSAGNTALHCAALYNQPKIIALLMKKDADATITGAGQFEETPLALAVRNGNAEAVQELIEWGASINTESGVIGMLRSALRNHHADVAAVLVNALVEESASGTTGSTTTLLNTALDVVAVNDGSRRLMRKLLNAGADFEFASTNGKRL